MSCISKILELKGDKEYYIPKENNKISVEDGGIHNGYEYLITFIQSGHRCGYVALPENHDLNKYRLCSYDCELHFKVHGGITFHEKSRGKEFGLKDDNCKDRWIGFDAAHCYDLQDVKLAIKRFGSCPYDGLMELLESPSVIIRSKKYMINQCKKLIDQVIKYEMENK